MSALAVAAVGGWMLALAAVDLRSRRLPNILTLPGAAVVLAAAAAAGVGGRAAAGALALAGAYLLVHLAAPAAMGAGDVKLALGLGALTAAVSWDTWAAAALLAPLLTAAAAVALALAAVARGKVAQGKAAQGAGPRSAWSQARARTVPHGPAMCLASAVLAGAALW